MNKIILVVDGKKEAAFSIDGCPKSEKELLKYDKYKEFYYRIGLNAPVTATVIVAKGLFKKEEYSFSFNVCGNAISENELQSIINKFSSDSRCEGINRIMDEGIIIYIYSFAQMNKSYKMYSELKDICNVGTQHMHDPNSGMFIVRIEYHEVR